MSGLIVWSMRYNEERRLCFGKYKRISDLKGAKIWFKVDTKQCRYLVQQGMKTVLLMKLI